MRTRLCVLLFVSACGGDEPAAPVLGKPCDHGGDLAFEGQRMTYDQTACGGEVCAFVVPLLSPKSPCTTDADCPEGDFLPFTCEAGACVISAATKAEHSMCATPCVSDVDCVDASADTLCASGFVCARFLSTCCESYCMCADDAKPGFIAVGQEGCLGNAQPDERFPACQL